MMFRTKVIPSGNATGVVVPERVIDAFASGKRPKVVIMINGHTWRSRVASMGGQFIIGFSAANRAASRIAEGDVVEVDLKLDTEARVVARAAGPRQGAQRRPGGQSRFRPPALWPQAQ